MSATRRRAEGPATGRAASVAVTSERVFTSADAALFAGLTAATWLAMANLLRQWGSERAHHSPATWGALTALLLVWFGANQYRWLSLPAMRRPRPMAPRPGRRVGVATTYVPGPEPLAMLERTVTALIALDYPHETWVLDEGDDAAVRGLCRRLGAHHFSRRHFPRFRTESGTFKARSKHGNYNAWLHAVAFARFDIVAAFDPDHVPARHFLTSVLGYFEDPTVGYVQAAQAYYNQTASFVARGAAEEVYGFYSSTLMVSYGLGHTMVFGCHNTHRVSALEAVGGLAPHDADDLLLTLRYRSAGWNGVYVPRILARGLTPVDWRGYIGQQVRWARSVLDVKYRLHPRLTGRAGWRERVFSFMHGLSYLREVVVNALGVGVVALVLAEGRVPVALSPPGQGALLALYLVLLGCKGYRQRFYLDPRERGWHGRARVLRLVKWPYVLAAAVDVLRGRTVPYALTEKQRDGRARPLILWPHLVIAAAVGAAWAAGAAGGRITSQLLHALAAAVVLGALAIAATSFWPFPPPWNPALLGAPGDDR